MSKVVGKGWEGRPAKELDEALTGLNEKVLFNEGRWYLSVADRTMDGDNSIIDLWHWCQDEGTDHHQYAASVVGSKFDYDIGKYRHSIDYEKCWNCPDTGEIPDKIKRLAERLFTGLTI